MKMESTGKLVTVAVSTYNNEVHHMHVFAGVAHGKPLVAIVDEMLHDARKDCGVTQDEALAFHEAVVNLPERASTEISGRHFRATTGSFGITIVDRRLSNPVVDE